jgi:hypothetical protein
MVRRSTLRGVLGVGGTGSALALATGGLAETVGTTAALALLVAVDELPGAGGADWVLQAAASNTPANKEMLENWARFRGTRSSAGRRETAEGLAQ